MFSALLANSIALFAAWLFFATALHKLSDLERAAELIAGYLGLHINRHTQQLSKRLAVLVLSCEFAVALCLLIPSSRAVACSAAMLMLALYFCAMAYQIAQDKQDMDCGCASGASNIKISHHLLWRNAALIMMLALVLPATSGGVGLLMGHLLALPAAMVMVLLYSCCEHLIGNAQKLALLEVN